MYLSRRFARYNAFSRVCTDLYQMGIALDIEEVLVLARVGDVNGPISLLHY